MSTVTNVKVTGGGPIEGSFEVDLSNGPGLRELQGDKACGKTTVLNAVSLLAGQKVTITINDKSKVGQVEGFGVVHPLTKKRRKGEPEVNFLDSSRCDLDELIDPDGRTPATRDAKRIKALTILTGVRLLDEDFKSAIGDDLHDQIEVAATHDPVLFATRYKAACDAKARELSDKAASLLEAANHEHEEAATIESQLPGGDIETDATKLVAVYEERTVQVAQLAARKVAAAKSEAEIKRLRTSLATQQAAHTGPKVADSKKALSEAIMAEDEATLEMRRLQELVIKAQASLGEAQQKRMRAAEVLKAATAHEEFVTSVNEQLSELTIEPVDDAEIAAAEELKTQAAAAVANGKLKREVIARRKRRDDLLESIKADRNGAEKWSSAGQAAVDLMIDKLDLKLISIKFIDGVPRLFVETARGDTYLDQDDGLSGGERVAVILREVLPHLPAPGAFAIPQPIYQELSPADRSKLAQLCRESGIYGWGGVISQGPLRSEFIV